MIENFINKNIECYENVSLKKYNTYKLDIKCKYLMFPKNVFELKEIILFARQNNYKYYVLGNGSNVIFKDNYYNGIIIKLDLLNKITISGNKIIASAGVSLVKLARIAINNSLKGLEFAAGIPGLVGASTAVNAGAYKEDIAGVMEEIKVLNEDLEVITMKNNDIHYSYRDSYLKDNKNFIILEATFNLQGGDKAEMLETIERRKKKRMESQPLLYPSAGSVFRNPKDMFAGELIEKCNLKGLNINGAEVSEKHANFIVNKGGATGEDIIKLISIIKDNVYEKFNVSLILEQIIIE